MLYKKKTAHLENVLFALTTRVLPNRECQIMENLVNDQINCKIIFLHYLLAVYKHFILTTYTILQISLKMALCLTSIVIYIITCKCGWL
jgi:hypothetical protein